MQFDNRVVTHQDDDVLHRRAMNLLSDLELFSVIQYGTRIRPSLEEAIRRTDSNPDFLKDMFEFGDSRNQNFGAKFTDWFSSSIPGCVDLNATMVSKIANSELFKDRAKEFIPQDFKFYFSNFSLPRKSDIIISYLTKIEKPENVFSAKQRILTPVILALKHLSASEAHDETVKAIHHYLEAHSIKNGAFVTQFAGAFQEQIKLLVDSFLDKKEIDVDQIAFFAKALSCLDSRSFKRPADSGASSIATLMSCGLLSDEFIVSALKKLVSQPDYDSKSLIPEVTNRRSLNIVSNFVSEKDLMNLGGRKVRGLLLENGLGI